MRLATSIATAPRRALAPLGLVLLAGCGARYEVRTPGPAAFDAAIVLGCPTLPDGHLSRCQVSRAVWAAELYRRGVVDRFITSGSAVHTPWVEAEALAAAMEALGVPADHIYLETEALHTDENIYNGLRLADSLGLRRVAVVSNKGHAAWACRMADDWKRPCSALSVDTDFLEAHQGEWRPRLAGLVVPRVPDGAFVPLDARERRRAQDLGRPRRLPSSLLYPYMGLLRLTGSAWIPLAPAEPPARRTWAERRLELAAR